MCNLINSVKANREAIIKAADKHGVTNVRLFGSVARGNAGPDSDIDILVDLEPGRNLFDLGGFLMDIQDILGRQVHVVTEGSVHWYIKNRILQEAQPL